MLISATSAQSSPAPPLLGCHFVDGEHKRPQLEVADIFRGHGEDYLREHPETSLEQRRLMKSIMACRTAELGGHRKVCTACGDLKDQSYNSCRHRMCPKCEGSKRRKWVEARMQELLPVDYQHMVFVPPGCLKWLILGNTRKVVALLFSSVACALQETAADPEHLGAEIGLLGAYQSWGTLMELHPHLHVCTPAGGISLEGDRWIQAKSDEFLPTDKLAERFRDHFLNRLEEAYDKGDLISGSQLQNLTDPDQFERLIAEARNAKWTVYSERVDGTPEAVVSYVGQGVPITNDRIRSFENGQVEIKLKTGADDRERTIILEAGEFIRRYLLHTLPPGFVRIRQYGFLANRSRKKKLARARKLLGVLESVTESGLEVGTYGDGHEDQQPITDDGEMKLCSVCGQRAVIQEALKRQPHPAWIFGSFEEINSS